jgi:hypothetical protein
MIFDFLRGKLEILLEKFNFSPGEIIKGKVFLELKKPILAKQLKIELAGLKITTRQITSPKGTPTTQTTKEFIFHFEMPLDGEKEYLKGEYPFEIKIPENVLQAPQKVPEGILATLLKTAEIASTIAGVSSRIEWYLEATLAIPKGFDMKKKVKINIG